MKNFRIMALLIVVVSMDAIALVFLDNFALSLPLIAGALVLVISAFPNAKGESWV